MMTNVLHDLMTIVTMTKNSSRVHLPLIVMTISSHDLLSQMMMKMTNRFRRLLTTKKMTSPTRHPLMTKAMTMINLIPQRQSQYLSQFLNLYLFRLSQRAACLEDQ